MTKSNRSDSNGINRRRLLQGLGGGSVLLLAGCSGSDDTANPDSSSSNKDEDDADIDSYESATLSYAYEISDERGNREDRGVETSTETTGFVKADRDGYRRDLVTTDGGDPGETETYIIDGVGYIRMLDECTQRQLRVPDPLQDVTVNYLQDIPSNPDDTTTFAGERVSVYETTHEDTPTGGGNLEFTATQYVSVDSGYLVGHEYSAYNDPVETSTTMRFHSFDEEFTVELPGNC